MESWGCDVSDQEKPILNYILIKKIPKHYRKNIFMTLNNKKIA
jgi:hypothetical protein